MTIAVGASVILLDEPTAGMSHDTDNAVELILRVSKAKPCDVGARHEGGNSNLAV